MAAVEARLRAMLPAVPVDRARRGEIDIATERLPRLVLQPEDVSADETQSPGYTHYTLTFAVVATLLGTTDLDLEQRLNAMHADLIAALAGWQPSTTGLGDVAQLGAEFNVYDPSTSKKPAGEVSARFSMLAVLPTGIPTV